MIFLKRSNRKSIVLTAICCLLLSCLARAQKPVGFTLAVKYNAKVGDTLRAGETYFLEEYQSTTFFSDSVSSDFDQFFFAGELLYPTAIRLFTVGEEPGINKLIFIEPGYQEIDLTNAEPASFSKIEQEHADFLKQMGISDIDKRISESVLEDYVKKRPASYIALFAMINQTFNYQLTPGIKHIASLPDSITRN